MEHMKSRNSMQLNGGGEDPPNTKKATTLAPGKAGKGPTRAQQKQAEMGRKEFKKKYGNEKPYIGDKAKKGLTRWFAEKWRNQRGEVGYKFKSDIYRPTKRITSKTPRTFAELSKLQLERARREKASTGRVNKF